MKSRITRTILSSALTATVVSAAIGLQPVTVLANVKDGSTLLGSFAVTDVTEPTVGANPAFTFHADETVDARLWWYNCADGTRMDSSAQFEGTGVYYAGITADGRTVTDPSTGNATIYELSPETTATINGKPTRLIEVHRDMDTAENVQDVFNSYILPFYFQNGVQVDENGVPIAPTPAPEPQPAAAPAPAAPVVTAHDQNEQAALQQQAMERELQAAGVAPAAPATTVASTLPNGSNFAPIRAWFQEQAKMWPGSAFSTYVKAADGDKDALWSLFSAAVNGDSNAIFAIYAAAANENPYALYEAQLLGFAM